MTGQPWTAWGGGSASGCLSLGVWAKSVVSRFLPFRVRNILPRLEPELMKTQVSGVGFFVVGHDLKLKASDH